eukprot:TRINITY_DN6387_c0_g1_i3.p1 TRINITY_DN6387_c0_g1~~TRINITY_DN6387_c0_g1_i3.p1  ORF type:complete len:288 (+),score=83.87 TRINITY_DN6387_c0_g1_i3:432-1295(+)
MVMDHVTTHRDLFRISLTDDTTIDDYIAAGRKLGTHAGEIELRATEELLDRPILVYCLSQADMQPNVQSREGCEDIEPIRLGYQLMHDKKWGNEVGHYLSARVRGVAYPMEWRHSQVLLEQRLRQPGANEDADTKAAIEASLQTAAAQSASFSSATHNAAPCTMGQQSQPQQPWQQPPGRRQQQELQQQQPSAQARGRSSKQHAAPQQGRPQAAMQRSLSPVPPSPVMFNNAPGQSRRGSYAAAAAAAVAASQAQQQRGQQQQGGLAGRGSAPPRGQGGKGKGGGRR